MSDAATLERIRSSAGLFVLGDRGLIRVAGSERARWLDGMISADVAALDEPGMGTPGLVLTHQGRLVAQCQVLERGDHYWLELAASAVAATLAHLDKLIIADDVELTDVSASFDRIAVEGARAHEVVASALGALDELRDGGVVERSWDDASVSVAAFGFTGLPALQLFVPAGRAAALVDALAEHGGEPAENALFECLRVEAGVPAWGRELDESVLPAEARLERAISTTKGCYTGQEVVTRMRSRGRVSHLLVGLAFDVLPEPGEELRDGDRKVGEITSVLRSPELGPIGLGYLKSDRVGEETALATAGGVAVRQRATAWSS